LTARPGDYTLLAHTREGEELGRLTRRVTLRSFGGAAVSDLLVARAWGPPEGAIDRAAMLGAVPRDLRFVAGDTIRLYAEVYGLVPAGAEARYRARYELLRTDDPERDLARAVWPAATLLEADRRARADGRGVVETLDLMPERVPPGTYLLRLELLAGAETRWAAGTIAFEVRQRR
jgi:hypothetical protein